MNEPTFLILTDDPPAIQCLMCGLTSYHPEDVKHRYCGKCNVFHDDLVRTQALRATQEKPNARQGD